ncbi:hypothetical protein MANES_12G097540v8 [Manihot esculenta]|uniref:Uncharacterized protein n=1 Tax=Manihot esculenta TaxID=3983 RepID=A0ACB7GQA4_MANES|nr:hypothetical protein MANES_12G097540v8 [Manihot esculenta]
MIDGITKEAAISRNEQQLQPATSRQPLSFSSRRRSSTHRSCNGCAFATDRSSAEDDFVFFVDENQARERFLLSILRATTTTRASSSFPTILRMPDDDLSSHRCCNCARHAC